MGWGDNGPDDGGTFEQRKQQAKQIIDRRLDDLAYDGGDLGDVAREVSDKTNIILTKREVKDIHRSGF